MKRTQTNPPSGPGLAQSDDFADHLHGIDSCFELIGCNHCHAIFMSSPLSAGISGS